MRDVLIVIPAYNEADTIGKVVSGLAHYADVLVTDDHSTDQTSAIAKLHGAKVITNGAVRGYESNLNNGYKFAIQAGYKYLVTVDADGQHDSHDVGRIISHLREGADLVLTIRRRFNRRSEIFVSLLSNFFMGQKDLLSGLKGYNLNSLKISNFDEKRLIGMELALIYLVHAQTTKSFQIEVNERHGSSRYGTNIRTEFTIALAGMRAAKYYMELNYSKRNER